MSKEIIGNSLPNAKKAAIIEKYVSNPYNIKGICKEFKISPALIEDCMNEYTGRTDKNEKSILSKWQTD